MIGGKSFEEFAIGDAASFSHWVSEEDVAAFARLSGDNNPLHIDEEYAKKTKLGGRVAHGMFLAALVSRLVGMRLPGKRSLVLFAEFRFKAPARIGDMVTVAGAVTAKSHATRIVEVAVEIKKESIVLVEGTVKVQVL